MKLEVSSRREKTKLMVIFAVLGFVMTFIATSFVLNAVYGIKPGDSDYFNYYDNDRTTPKTPYENLVINGCLKEQIHEGDEKIFMDTKGLDEVGLDLIDKNICFDYAKYIAGYTIDSVEVDKNGDMIITLTKK